MAVESAQIIRQQKDSRNGSSTPSSEDDRIPGRSLRPEETQSGDSAPEQMLPRLAIESIIRLTKMPTILCNHTVDAASLERELREGEDEAENMRQQWGIPKDGVCPDLPMNSDDNPAKTDMRTRRCPVVSWSSVRTGMRTIRTMFTGDAIELFRVGRLIPTFSPLARGLD